MDLGVRDDLALRLTGLFCFLVTGVLLLRARSPRGRNPPAPPGHSSHSLLSALRHPLGRTSMIEYLATAGAVGFAWSTIVWRESAPGDFLALSLSSPVSSACSSSPPLPFSG